LSDAQGFYEFVVAPFELGRVEIDGGIDAGAQLVRNVRRRLLA
jgi:hypothetical protein